MLPGGQPPLDIAGSGATGLLVASQAGLFVPDNASTGWRNLLANVLPGTGIVPTAVSVMPSERIVAGVIGGVVVSDDRGTSWRAIPFRSPAPTVSSLVPVPEESMILAATLEDGVFLSENDGEHWTAWNFGLFDRCVLDLSLSRNFALDHSVLAITQSGCFLSRNSGRSWIDLPLPPDVTGFTASCATGTSWLLATAEGVLYALDAAGQFDPNPVATLNTGIVTLLPRDETSILALADSGAVITIDPEGQASPVITGESRSDAFVTCAALTGSSLVLGWSDGCVTTDNLRPDRDKP
jgi:photosystem II stability/assembly factor-like uncharacterized protein